MERMGNFHVHVTKDYLVFCAGHFITYHGHQCEALHGHNYRVGVWLNGPVDENHYVFDFVTLKQIMRRLVDELDHRMLLPMHNPRISLVEEQEGIWVHVTGEKPRRYFFPHPDVVVLPISNTTAEMLAHYLCTRLKRELMQLEQQAGHLTEIAIEVEESFGQSAVYREEVTL